MSKKFSFFTGLVKAEDKAKAHRAKKLEGNANMEELKKKPPGVGVKKETSVHPPAGEAGGDKAQAAALCAVWLLFCALTQACMVSTPMLPSPLSPAAHGPHTPLGPTACSLGELSGRFFRRSNTKSEVGAHNSCSFEI